ncbi:MAG: hypothetical protein D6747_06415 [Chlorobiota bacterium]|jgi:flagellar biosynthetic protein FliO|nr:MAG: hypothetical protein D6747_06415 [Chlorobiota bacterium]
MDWTLLNAALIVAAAVAVLAVLAIVVRRLSHVRSSGNSLSIRILARQPVGNKAMIVVVEIERKRVVLGVTEQSVSLLATLPEAPAPTPSRQATPQQPNHPRQPQPATPAELSFRAYLASMFQRSGK